MADRISPGTEAVNANITRISKAKEDLLNQERNLIKEQERTRYQGARDMAKIQEQARRDVEWANRKSDEERARTQELNSQNLEILNQENVKKMNALVEKTTKDFENLSKRALDELHALQNAKTEKLLETATRAEDVFYRPKHFSTEIEEKESFYNIKIKLPPYEARDVSVSGFSNQLNISFNRAYEANTQVNPTQENRTRSHESVTETYYLPTNINFKNVERSYENGVLSLRVAKANPLLFDPLTSKKIS